MAFNDTFKNFTDVTGNSKGGKTADLIIPKNLKKFKIIAVDEVTNSTVQELLINPNTITDQKSSNWAKYYVPGQTDPLLQWISGSERVVSFSIKVTKDTPSNRTITTANRNSDSYTLHLEEGVSGSLELDNRGGIPAFEGDILRGLQEVSSQTSPGITLDSVGNNIANAFSNPFGSTAASTTQIDEAGDFVKYYPLSIQKYLDYYRSLVIPRKSALSGKAKSPTLIKLELGDVLGNRSLVDKMRWILLDYNITVTKLSPELIPIDAQVNFTFIEYVDSNRVINVNEFPTLNRIDGKNGNEQIESKTTEFKDENFRPGLSGSLATPIF